MDCSSLYLDYVLISVPMRSACRPLRFVADITGEDRQQPERLTTAYTLTGYVSYELNITQSLSKPRIETLVQTLRVVRPEIHTDCERIRHIGWCCWQVLAVFRINEFICFDIR